MADAKPENSDVKAPQTPSTTQTSAAAQTASVPPSASSVSPESKPAPQASQPQADPAPVKASAAEISAAVAAPSRPSSAVVRRVIDALAPKPEPQSLNLDDTPWTLQQFFNGEIDLDAELAQRFQSMPVMATVNFRSTGTKSKRGVATLATQDGAAQVIVDVDSVSKVAQFSFTFGAMLTLRFKLSELSDVDRTRWLELMRRKEGGLTFLWGPNRWEQDYLICVARRYYTNLYAFSPHNFEAAVRLTPEVTRALLHWLDTFWKVVAPKEEPPAPLLTW